jgi:hypothetical protein
MSSRERAGTPARLVLQIGQIPTEDLYACARALARIVVQKSLSDQWFNDLDTGSTISDNGDQNIAAPASVDAPTGAKERVR